MSTRFLPHFALSLVAVLCLQVCADQATQRNADFFEARIRPVLVEHCYECHAADSEDIGGQFLLDSRDALFKGGESGPAVEAGNADGSLLLRALRYDDLEMPPTGKLPDRVIADFEKWINDGAFDPRNATPANQVAETPSIDIEAGRQFWAFQQPRLHEPPAVHQTGWPIRKIDHFVLSRIETENSAPQEEADRRTLIRRVTFDLTGLPPTPEEVEAFVNDDTPGAYRRVVERLLASPQFGARWARLWLDVSRYAEDQAHIVGNNQELFYPNAYRYRDWLIGAFNDDLPYDRFLKLQLAADLMEGEEEHTVALGFLGLGPKYYRRNAPEVMADEWEDRVDTVSRGLLGLTVACARCHDHKYDPIPTEDYYALAGVFASTSMFNRPPDGWKPTGKKKKPEPSETLHVIKDAKPQDLKVHIRGDAFNLGEVAPRRFLQVTQAHDIPLNDGSGRLQLAGAITDPANPLTARVIVNRIWAEYFGNGIVATPSNFGELGQRPTHPELLDDLAVRFMNEGWSLKWLHREIVMSATYRQSSNANTGLMESDPENSLLARMPVRRLSVEMWRDAMLSVSAKLTDELGGKSLDVQDPTETRRTVYSKVSRLELDSMLKMFDFPDPNVHAANRAETITPLQKLFALNSEFVVARARDLAERIFSDRQNASEQIKLAYQLLFTREPSQNELELGLSFVSSTGEGDKKSQWVQYAQILLASNEMMYLD